YTIYYKSKLPVEGSWPTDNKWDVFISAYTAADRVRQIYQKVEATTKHWLVFPEYGFTKDECDAGSFIGDVRQESDFIKAFWPRISNCVAGARICIDTTGFIRPYLLFLMKWLHVNGVTKFDALYTEPVKYKKGEQTKFSDESVVEVRQVIGFEGI